MGILLKRIAVLTIGFQTLKQVKRLTMAAIGFITLGVGIAMILLPGPAILVIPLGLSILATEFVWAKKLLEKTKARLKKRMAPRIVNGL